MQKIIPWGCVKLWISTTASISFTQPCRNCCHSRGGKFIRNFSQIFFLVILFAAYNGLVFLPVLLSVAGPGQRRSGSSSDHTEKPKNASKDVAMLEVTKKLNGESVQKEEQEGSEVKERLLENGEVAWGAVCIYFIRGSVLLDVIWKCSGDDYIDTCDRPFLSLYFKWYFCKN